MTRVPLALILTGLFLLPGCLSTPTSEPADFRLATTTSMRDSGLLDLLVEEFEQLHDVDVEYVAVGTGAALHLGENRDVDALIVHAPQQEETFLESGHGYNRTQIAWNAFVLLSPKPLPPTLVDAFQTVVDEERCFVSRGDNSGTHLKEQAIWSELATVSNITLVEDANGVHPVGDWYYSIGQGMGAAINMAHEKGCVTLSDRGTALQFQSSISLDRYEYDDEAVYNPYSFITVTGGNEAIAHRFLEYLLNEGSDTIANYTIGGEAAFFV